LQLWGIYFCNFVHFYYATNTIGKKGIKGFASDIKNAINLKIGVKGADKTTTQRLKTNLQLFAEKKRVVLSIYHRILTMQESL